MRIRKVVADVLPGRLREDLLYLRVYIICSVDNKDPLRNTTIRVVEISFDAICVESYHGTCDL